MSAMQIFSLNAARQGRAHLEQLAGIFVNDSTATSAMRQQVAAALTEVNDVIETLEKQLEAPAPNVVVDIMVNGDQVEAGRRIAEALPRLPRRVPGATLA